MKKNKITGVIMLWAILAMTGCSAPSTPETLKVESVTPKSIHINSIEKIMAVPDIAEIVIGIYTQNEDSLACQTQNNNELNMVLNKLTDAGIAETSLQTSGYGLSPIYDWNSGNAVTGYEMTTTITISDVNINDVGQIISDCVEAGVNNIQSISYLSSEYDTYYQNALQKAIEAAKSKAEIIASASNCTLGDILEVEELTVDQYARYNASQSTYVIDQSPSSSMKVLPGQISIEANISVNFEIK